MTAHEQQRLAVLHECHPLDAPAGDELEAVVRVAAMVAGVPTATLDLIDEHRVDGELVQEVRAESTHAAGRKVAANAWT